MGRSNIQSTLKLALELMRRIPRSRKVTAAELRQQLAAVGIRREIRAIQQMLLVLSEMFDIERDEARPIGYRWKAQATGFVVARMTEQESLLLMLAQKQLAALLPPSLMQALDGFFEQARRELDPYGDDTLARQWLGKVHVSSAMPQLIPPKIGQGVLETVSHALYTNLPLKLRYCNAEGRRSEKHALPLGLVQQDARMYLVAQVKGYEKPVSLAVHRMLKAVSGERAFERPAGFDLKQFDAEGGISHATGRHVRVSFRLARRAGQHVVESPLAADQRHVDEGSHLRFEATCPDSLRLDRWLWSFGPDISEIRKETVCEERAGEGQAREKPAREEVVRGQMVGAGRMTGAVKTSRRDDPATSRIRVGANTGVRRARKGRAP